MTDTINGANVVGFSPLIIKGDKGDTGAPGGQGIPGPQGQQGNPGVPGTDGMRFDIPQSLTLAQQAQAQANMNAASASLAPNSLLEGLFIYAFGNSYLTRGSANTPIANTIYFDRLRLRLRSISWFNAGVGGTRAIDSAAYMYGTATKPIQGANSWSGTLTTSAMTANPVQWRSGFTLLECGRNDAGGDGITTSGGTTAKSRASFTNGLDAAIRLLRASAKIGNSRVVPSCGTTITNPVVTTTAATWSMQGQLVTGTNIPANTYVGTVVEGVSFRLSSSRTSQVDVNATATGSVTCTIAPLRVGTWTTSAQNLCSNGLISSTTTNGNTVSYVVNLPYAARLTWVGLGIDQAANAGVAGSTASISVDGGAAITQNLNDQVRVSGTTGAMFGQMAVDLGSYAAGFHTVVVTNAGTTGQDLFDDCLLIESPTPSTVVITKVAQLGAAGYAYSGYPNSSWTVDQIYNSIIDTVVARFPNDGSVVSCDPNPGWDPNTMITSVDGLFIHPNDIGMEHYADALMGTLRSLAHRSGLVVIT